MQQWETCIAFTNICLCYLLMNTFFIICACKFIAQQIGNFGLNLYIINKCILSTLLSKGTSERQLYKIWNAVHR